MNEDDMLNQFIKQLGSGLEHAAETLGKLPKEEIQAQLQQVARNTLVKMDLVTREEFEVQAAMLTKYRERLIALEARLAELETPASAVKKAPVKRASAAKTTPAAKATSITKKAPAKKMPAKGTEVKDEHAKSSESKNVEPKE